MHNLGCILFCVCIICCYVDLIAEINECQDGNSSCEQACMNTIGSYECACYDGYRLNQDGLTCTGNNNYVIKFYKLISNSIPFIH